MLRASTEPATFRQTDGDIAAVLKTMFASPEFKNSLGTAFKDPMHYAISAIRLAYDDKVILNAGPILGWLGRMAQPDEIARAAVFLASDNAGFITGQTLHINGGSYLA